MELLGRYKNGNYFVTFLSDGTKIRETNEDELFHLLQRIVIAKLLINAMVDASGVMKVVLQMVNMEIF